MGEAVYASGSEIRTRRWTWRQSERGKITEATKQDGGHDLAAVLFRCVTAPAAFPAAGGLGR